MVIASINCGNQAYFSFVHLHLSKKILQKDEQRAALDLFEKLRFPWHIIGTLLVFDVSLNLDIVVQIDYLRQIACSILPSALLIGSKLVFVGAPDANTSHVITDFAKQWQDID